MDSLELSKEDILEMAKEDVYANLHNFGLSEIEDYNNDE